MEHEIRIRTIALISIFLMGLSNIHTQDLFRNNSMNFTKDSPDIAYDSTVDYKLPHIIKTNPTLYLRGNFNLSYEFFVYKRVSFELQAGIVIPSQIWINFVESMLYHVPEEDLSRQYYSGYEYRIQAKFLFMKNAPFQSMYASPMFLFSKLQGDKVWVSYPDTERSQYNFNYERLESGKVRIKSFGVTIGYMFSIKRKWFFDVYLGFGEERIEEYDRYVHDMIPCPMCAEDEYVPHPLPDWNHPSTRFFTGFKIGYNLR
ncbi:MAG: DUF3575 domain-containing protein [Bacteroidota bacterium]